ncbi:MAG: M16 family metallopeptidase, partial [Gemmatimonadales bacterium]
MSTAPTHGLRREQLANGVTLLVKRRRFAPAAALATHVRAGFLDEPDDIAGISHVLEHMLFKGTATLGPGELARRTKALGGTLNAYTSYDATVYYAAAPAANASELIALQADQVRNPALDADELRRELGVIIQEARRKLDSPGAAAGETLHALLFQVHRIRRWRIGSEAVLQALTRDEVARYYATRYVPSRVIVAMVADLDEEAALDGLRAGWQDWTAPATTIQPGPAEHEPPVPRTRRLDGDVEVATLALGWRAPGVLDVEIPALDFAAAILGAGRGSRLIRTMRDPGLASAVGTSRYGVHDTGVFAIDAELEPENLPAVLAAAAGSIRDLADHGADDMEFQRARNMLLARTARRLERYQSLAIALAAAEALGDVTRLDREASEFLAVTPAAVREVARRWLAPGQASAVAYLPRAAASG